MEAQVDTIRTAIEPTTSHQAIPDESTAKRMITVSGEVKGIQVIT
jgi:hypothetical protein